MKSPPQRGKVSEVPVDKALPGITSQAPMSKKRLSEMWRRS
jgi:hypothetical protein